MNVGWQRGRLILTLDWPVTGPWIETLRNKCRSRQAPPAAVSFDGAQSSLNAQEYEAQAVVDNFKTWLP